MILIRKVQFSVTIGALAATLVHMIWPDLAIDSVTIALLVLAAIPWLVPLFKTLEFPGGWKLEFQDLEKTTEKAEIAGLLDSRAKPIPSAGSPLQIEASEDPRLALAELRIEIQRRLNRLATAGGLDLKAPRIGFLLHCLVAHDLLTPEQRGVLEDIIGMLNTNVNAPVTDYWAAKWAVDIGPKLLKGMDKQIEGVSQSERSPD